MKTPKFASKRDEVLWHFARERCVCTKEELEARYSPTERAALAKAGVDFEGTIKDHNPLYYIAQQVWFDNPKARGNPAFLYKPLHQELLCKLLMEHILCGRDGVFSGIVMLLPRDTFKSTFAHRVVPMWFALREKYLFNRDARIALIHHKEKQASANLVLIKQKSYGHEWFKKTWPEFAAPKDFGTMTEFDWPCKEQGRMAEPSMYAIGLGGRMTGWHFDLMIYDDAVTEDHIDSKTIRDQAFNKYQISRYMLDTVTGVEVCTGTRYHMQDLWGKLLKANVDGTLLYRRIVRPAINDKTDELLHPHRLTEAFLEKRRQEEISVKGTDVLWHLQYQNQPKSSGILAADWNWVKFIASADIPRQIWRVIFVDPAWKGTKNAGKGDDAAIAVVGFERRGHIVLRYLLDIIASNELDSHDGERVIYRMMKKWAVVDVAPEEHGGYNFRTNLEQNAGSHGLIINIIDLKSKQTNKFERIATFMNEVKAGHFLVNTALKGEESFEDKFKDQFESFPQCEPNDALDATAYSCDPEIMDNFAPRFAFMNQKAAGEQPTEYATRHCTR